MHYSRRTWYVGLLGVSESAQAWCWVRSVKCTKAEGPPVPRCCTGYGGGRRSRGPRWRRAQQVPQAATLARPDETVWGPRGVRLRDAKKCDLCMGCGYLPTRGCHDDEAAHRSFGPGLSLPRTDWIEADVAQHFGVQFFDELRQRWRIHEVHMLAVPV